MHRTCREVYAIVLTAACVFFLTAFPSLPFLGSFYLSISVFLVRQVLGRDHTETINNYVHLGQYYYVAKQISKALVVLRHAGT